jgi:hypothetical protein
MENLIWILPLLVCPVGMLLMGAVVWFVAKLGLRSSEPGEQPRQRRDDAPHRTPLAPSGAENA